MKRPTCEPQVVRQPLAATLDSQARQAPVLLCDKIITAVRIIFTCKNWANIITTVALGKIPRFESVLPASIEVRSRGGLSLSSPRTTHQSGPLFELIADDVYRLKELPWDADRLQSLSVLDIGAHVGAFAVMMAVRYPAARISCFEPSPVAASYLDLNLEKNELVGRISCYRAAVAARPGSRQLLSNGPASAESTLLRALSPPNAVGIQVNVIDFATAVALSGPPDLIKLDCEGSEYEIILETHDELWKSVRCVLLEYHAVPGYSWARLEQRLGGLGLRCTWHEPSRRIGQGIAMLLR